MKIEDKQNKKVFFLGAGFSKAINEYYPTLNELSGYTISSFTQTYPHGAIREHFDSSPNCLKINIENFLSYLCLKHPWKSPIEQDLDNALYKALINEIALILGNTEKIDKTEQTKRMPDFQPSDDIINLIKYINGNKYASITLNYDTLFERITSKYCKYKNEFFNINSINGYCGIKVYIKNIADIDEFTNIKDFEILESNESGRRLIKLVIDESFLNNLDQDQFMGLFKNYAKPSFPLQQVFWTLKSNFIKSKTFLTPNEYGSELIKLHGSLDWLYINEANSIKFLKEDEVREYSEFCQPFIIPPISDKNTFYNQNIIERQWAKAHKAISQAEEIYIIGFSFPMTDLSAKFLFQSALRGNNAKIYVINPDNSEDLKNRYIEIFREENLNFDFCGEQKPLNKFIKDKILTKTSIL